MSDIHNEQWLEDARQHFQEAVLNEDWAFARAVIADLKENGFMSQGIALEVELAQKQGVDHEVE